MRHHRSVVLAGMLVAPVTQAGAQYLVPLPPQENSNRAIAVGDRRVPGYEAEGIRTSGLIVSPTLKAAAIYSDNVLAVEDGARSDVALRLSPGVRVRPDWPIHSLSFSLQGQFDRYARLQSENFDGFDADLQGTYSPRRDSNVRARLRWQRLQEPRSSQNAFAQTRRPLRYDQMTAAIGITQDFNRLRVSGELAAVKTNYFDGLLLDGSPASTAGRDNVTLSARARIEFVQSPSLGYFVQATVNRRNFRAATVLRPERDSEGYELLAGVRLEPSALLRGEIGVGYLAQDYESAFYRDNGGLGVNAKVLLFPTQLTTVTASAEREVIDSGNPLSSAFLSTAIGLKVDHELLRTLVISAGFDYRWDRFNDIDRRDRRYGPKLAAEYLVNRRITLNATASRLRVESDGSERYRDLSENRLMLGVGFRI